MNDEIVRNALIGAIAGFLLIFLFRSSSNKKSSRSEAPIVTSKKDLCDEVPQSLFDRWAVKLALVGGALGVFAALGQGSTQIGIMIGFGIPIALIGFIIGVVVDSLVKPTSPQKRESSAKKRSATEDITSYKTSSSIPTLKLPEPKDRDFQRVVVSVNPAEREDVGNKIPQSSAVTFKAPCNDQPKTWYESEFGIGQKTSDLYLMHYEIRRQTGPETGYQVLYSHPRKAGQQIPRFIPSAEIDKPQILGNQVTSLCPTCNTRCAAQLEQVSYFGCRECKSTWWQKR
jgi:hypothetical protein